jgi:hypothetical protein
MRIRMTVRMKRQVEAGKFADHKKYKPIPNVTKARNNKKPKINIRLLTTFRRSFFVDDVNQINLSARADR